MEYKIARIQVEFYKKKIFNNKNIKKILLINSAHIIGPVLYLISIPAIRGRNMNYPPYGLGLISSHLDLLKIHNKILNFKSYNTFFKCSKK